MEDSTMINAFYIIKNNDTVTYVFDKEVINLLKKEKTDNVSHYVEILIPVFVALISIVLTKIIDNWSRNNRYKNETIKENRLRKTQYLKYLITLKISLDKPHFPNADYDDFLNWVADKMLRPNPFEELKVNSIVIFNGNKKLIELIDELFNKAERIDEIYNWSRKEHTVESLKIAEKIYAEFGELIDQIAKTIN